MAYLPAGLLAPVVLLPSFGLAFGVLIVGTFQMNGMLSACHEGWEHLVRSTAFCTIASEGKRRNELCSPRDACPSDCTVVASVERRSTCGLQGRVWEVVQSSSNGNGVLPTHRTGCFVFQNKAGSSFQRWAAISRRATSTLCRCCTCCRLLFLTCGLVVERPLKQWSKSLLKPFPAGGSEVAVMLSFSLTTSCRAWNVGKWFGGGTQSACHQCLALAEFIFPLCQCNP